MQYAITICYDDHRTMDIHTSDAEANDFCAALQRGEMYWSRDAGQGIWANVSKIRYMTIKPLKPETHDPRKKNGKNQEAATTTPATDGAARSDHDETRGAN